MQKHNHPYSSMFGQKAFTSMLNFFSCLSIQQAAITCYIQAHGVATATLVANTNAIIFQYRKYHCLNLSGFQTSSVHIRKQRSGIWHENNKTESSKCPRDIFYFFLSSPSFLFCFLNNTRLRTGPSLVLSVLEKQSKRWHQTKAGSSNKRHIYQA